jgi:hypothetical protein
MSLQIIENSDGKPAGVFIPMNEWIKLKKQFKDLNSLELVNNNILSELKISLDELKKIEKGELNVRPVNELIDEL